MRALVLAAVLVACSKSKDDGGKAAPAGKATDELKDYANRSKAIEAELQLGRIGTLAKGELAASGVFPKGSSATLPAQPCCGNPGGTCPVTADWASDPVWKQLGFQIEDPSRYQYHYESDGQTFTATAVGDTDCDQKTATFTLTGKLENGNATVTLSKPPAGVY